MEGLKNMMEDNVEYTLNRLLPTMPNVCSCEDCRLDMATYALNRLHPKYTRTSKGAILHRFDAATTQVEAEILTACVSAINIIGSHPHHEAKGASAAQETDSALENDASLEADSALENNTAQEADSALENNAALEADSVPASN